MNPSKRKGTAGETAVTRYCRDNGFSKAERRALHGTLDRGDIKICDHWIAEVKTGKTAAEASWAQIRRWWAETERERVNAGAPAAMLVVQRRGIGLSQPGKWTAYQTSLYGAFVATDLSDLIEYIRGCCDE